MTAALAATVVVSGGLAAIARHLVSVWFSADQRFPWAVLTVNIVGSALSGVVLGLGAGLDGDLRLILLTGVAGGLTTFSTFSVETIQLVLDGRTRVAALNVAANLSAGLAATSITYMLALAL